MAAGRFLCVLLGVGIQRASDSMGNRHSEYQPDDRRHSPARPETPVAERLPGNLCAASARGAHQTEARSEDAGCDRWLITGRVKPLAGIHPVDDAFCCAFGFSQDAGVRTNRLIGASSVYTTFNSSRHPPPRTASTKPSIRRCFEAAERGFLADDGAHWSDIGLFTYRYNDSLARAVEDNWVDDSTHLTQVHSFNPAYVHDSCPSCCTISLCTSIHNL